MPKNLQEWIDLGLCVGAVRLLVWVFQDMLRTARSEEVQKEAKRLRENYRNGKKGR
jgi:hypothetical protein